MGFQLRRTEYDVPFDDSQFAGLKIRARAMTVDERLNVFFSDELATDPKDTLEQFKAKQDRRFQMFIDHVVEWNIEDECGEPLPVTLEGLYKVAEPQQIGSIVGTWASGRMTVAVPLEPASPATRLSEIPMTVQESTPELVSSTVS